MTEDTIATEQSLAMLQTSLAAKVAAASKKIGGLLASDKENTDQGYWYNSANLILSEAGQALAEQGVAVLPTILEADVVASTYGKEGKTRYDAKVQFLMVVTDGIEKWDALWIGMGSDYVVPDKAYFKAVTSGHKYFLAKIMNIGAFNEDGEHETGDPEATGKSVKKPVFSAGPKCPKCGGDMWDNRSSKTKPNQPDFKCKKKRDVCDGAIWNYVPPAEPEPVTEMVDEDDYVTLVAVQKTPYNGQEYLPGQNLTIRNTLALELLDTKHWITDLDLAKMYEELAGLLQKLYGGNEAKIKEAVQAASRGAATLLTELNPPEVVGLIKIAKGRLAKASPASSVPEVMMPDEIPIFNADPEGIHP